MEKRGALRYCRGCCRTAANRGGDVMRWSRSKRWRCVLLLTALVAVAAVGLWCYLAVTRDPITFRTFQELRVHMTRAEIESRLCGPAAEVRDTRDIETFFELGGFPPP